MIIVTAEIGLFPLKSGKKRAYITDKRIAFAGNGKMKIGLETVGEKSSNQVIECERLRTTIATRRF